MKKIDYVMLFPFIGSIIGVIRHLIAFIKNNQTLDLVMLILYSIILVALVTSYVVLIIYKINTKKKNQKLIVNLKNSFPAKLKDDVEVVLNNISKQSDISTTLPITVNSITTYKLENENIDILYRMYYEELDGDIIKELTNTQYKILCCIYTRHHNGYIREKYLNELLELNIEEWEIPFIIKLCDEYVVEILDLIYNKLSKRNNEDIKLFSLNNKMAIHKGYERMTSYWNGFYRSEVYQFKNYVGRKLFREILCYDKSFKNSK